MIFLGALFLAYILFTLTLFFFFRGKLNRLTHYAARLSEGEPHGGFPDTAGPFRALASSIDDLSTRLGDKISLAEAQTHRTLAILESMTEGVVVMDSDQKITLINSVLAQAISFQKNQVQGCYFWEVFRDPHLNAMISEALERRHSISKEHTLLLSQAVYQIRVSPVFSGGDFLGLVAVFYDVTQIKEFERLRSEFVANVSHELKTPLTSIIGFVETLKDGAFEDRENSIKFLHIIEENSKKLYRLIEDLLLLSRIESGKDELSKEKVDLERIMDGIVKSFVPALRAKKIKIRVDARPSPFIVMADPKSLEEALCNLVDNAVKYSLEGGDIRVSAFYEGGLAKIQIADQGIGISEADLGRVFERFFRVDRSRSRESGGSGLGLSIAKHIIERHSGRIEVKSVLQQGSTFTVTLPPPRS